jgi:tight adherence protein B
MTVMMVMLFVSFALLFAAVLWFIYKRVNNQARIIVKRVKDLSRDPKKSGGAENVPFIVRNDQLSKIPVLNKILEKLDVSKSLRSLLDQAGSKMQVGQFVLLSCVLAAVGCLAGLKSPNAVLRLALPLIMAALPLMQVRMQRARRLRAFIRAFPDTIDMMTSAIRAGHAFNQAMQLVGDEAPDPVGVEFKRTFEQHNLGINLREALMNLAGRVDSLDLRLFITAILLQRETGGNLTEILEKISYTIRERFKLIGQIKTYTAQGRMSAMIVGSLPIAFMLIISALNPGYLKPLFEDKLGHLFVVVSGFLQVLGFIIINKIVRIKYQ